MARQLSDDTIRLNIIINGNQAQKELLDLDKQTRTLTAANKDLRKEKAALKEQLLKETTATRAVSATIKEQSDILAANKKKTAELRAERTALAKDGQRDSDRYKELTAEIKTNSDAVKANVARIQELHKEKKALQQQALTESSRYKEITEEIKLNNATIDANKARMSPDTKAMLIRELRGIKGFEKGMYNNDVTGGRYEVPAAAGSSTPLASGSITLDQALAIINRNTDVMEKIHRDGLIAYMSRDGRELKKFQEELDRVNQSKQKAQQ